MASDAPERDPLEAGLLAKVAAWTAVLESYRAAKALEGVPSVEAAASAASGGRPMDLPVGVFRDKGVKEAIPIYLQAARRKHMSYINDGDPDGAEGRSVPIVLLEKVTGPLAAPAITRATGLRPALFRDFFNEDLFFTAQLRRKRYELRAAVNGNQFSWSRHELPA